MAKRGRPETPHLVDTECSSASRTPSGERFRKHSAETMSSPGADPPFPSGSGISWSLTRARSFKSRSHARLCVLCPEALRAGSGGASPVPCAARRRADANIETRIAIVQPVTENHPPHRVKPQNPITSSRASFQGLYTKLLNPSVSKSLTPSGFVFAFRRALSGTRRGGFRKVPMSR